MKLNTWHQNILSAIIMAVGGFILWNAAFVLAAAVNRLFGLATEQSDGSENNRAWMYAFLFVVLLISWLIFRAKKLHILVKATYLSMPLMVVLILGGIQFYQQPKWVPIMVGGVVVLGVLGFLLIRKLTWQYYFATAFTAVVAFMVVLFDVQI